MPGSGGARIRSRSRGRQPRQAVRCINCFCMPSTCHQSQQTPCWLTRMTGKTMSSPRESSMECLSKARGYP